MQPHRRLFWALVLPFGATTVLAAEKYSAKLAVAPTTNEIADKVLHSIVPYCVPEPKEQLLFVLSVTIPVLLAFVATVALRAMGAFRSGESSNPLLSTCALVAQVAVVYLGWKGMVVQGSEVYGYRFFAHGPIFAAILLVGLFVMWTDLHVPLVWHVRALWARISRYRLLPWLLAVTWICMFAVTGLYREAEIPRAPPTLGHHMPFTMGEFAAAVNGRIPLIDFYSQYQNLQCLLVLPIFKLFGFGIGSYSIVMFGFTTLGFVLLYASLCHVCESRWFALVLFAPFVALSFYSAEGDGGEYLSNLANYFASGPTRYFSVCVLAWAATWYLRRPSVARLVVVVAGAALVALNNLDFGIPSAIGVVGCALLFPPKIPGLSLPARIVSVGLVSGFIALSTLGLYCLAIRFTAGAWPALEQLTAYQRAFALLGCHMMPMPSVGMHWVVFFTAVAAVVIPIFETFSSDHDCITDNRRMINGSLAYSGLATIGSIAYYVGRSHHLVFASTFFCWGYTLIQFVHRNWRFWRDAQTRPRETSDFLIAIPLAASLGLFILVSSMAFELPSPSKQLHRLTMRLPKHVRDAGLVDLIKKYTRPNDATAIAYRDGHWLALRAGVNNVYPFAQENSIFFKDQLNAVTATLVGLPPHRERFFGNPPPELRDRLADSGFVRIDGIGDFDVWSKEPQ